MTVSLAITRRVMEFAHLTENLQLLNTLSNLGGTWPRFFVLNGN